MVCTVGWPEQSYADIRVGCIPGGGSSKSCDHQDQPCGANMDHSVPEPRWDQSPPPTRELHHQGLLSGKVAMEHMALRMSREKQQKQLKIG